MANHRFSCNKCKVNPRAIAGLESVQEQLRQKIK